MDDEYGWSELDQYNEVDQTLFSEDESEKSDFYSDYDSEYEINDESENHRPSASAPSASAVNTPSTATGSDKKKSKNGKRLALQERIWIVQYYSYQTFLSIYGPDGSGSSEKPYASVDKIPTTSVSDAFCKHFKIKKRDAPSRHSFEK